MNRLHRSAADRILAGVAGGMAETYDVDPALVRIGWAFLILITGGLFLLVYAVMAIALPLDPAPAALWDMPGAPVPSAAGGAPVPPGPTGAPMGGPTPPPLPPPGYYNGRRHQHRDGSGALVIGVILVLVGAYFLFRQFMPIFDWGLFWPLIVIAGGVLLIVAAFGRPRGTT